jgi:TolA-binding protein
MNREDTKARRQTRRIQQDSDSIFKAKIGPIHSIPVHESIFLIFASVFAPSRLRGFLFMTCATIALSSITLAQDATPPATQPTDRKARLAAMANSKLEADAADLYRTAETTYLVGDTKRAAELYQKEITLNSRSSVNIRAHARLGDCAFEEKNYEDAAAAYRRASQLGENATDPDERAAAVRSDFMVGYSYVGARQYTQAFGQLRRFIDRHGGDPLVNIAYQAIGDAHLALQQYQQALDAYRMVGTTLDQHNTAGHRITPGERLYLRVEDADVNIGDTPKTVNVVVKTTSGDVETVTLQPLGLHNAVFIGSIPTLLGSSRHSDDITAIMSADVENHLREQLAKAKSLRDQADQREQDAKDLEASPANNADPAGIERKHAAALADSASFRKQADDLDHASFTAVDICFAALESKVAPWDPQQSLDNLRQRATAAAATQPAAITGTELNVAGLLDSESSQSTTRPAVLADQDINSATLSNPDDTRRGMDQRQIDAIRLDVAHTPTTADTVDRRITALAVWSQSLHEQFQALELVGSDQITIEYFDEIGPHGPNDPVKAIRRQTLQVASDARIAMLTPDGRSPLDQMILGGDVLLRVEDADRDMTDQRDTVQVTLAALPPTLPQLADLVPTTQPIASFSTPGQIESATTQPIQILPLVPPDAQSITATLTETGSHTGVFERVIHLDATSVSIDEQSLSLAEGGRLRMAYRDDVAVRHPDGWVLAQEATLAASRDATVAAVQYQKTRLDLDAQLRRAIAAGEVGKVYLDMGLVQRGRDYLSSAQADCTAVATNATGTPLGEEAMYHSWRIYFYAGLLDDAAAAARQLMAKYPQSDYVPKAMLALGQVSLERGQQAAEEAKEAGKEPGLNRDLQRAVTDLDALVKKYPRSDQAPEALFLIGRAQIAAGKTGIESFEQLAKQYPDSGFAPRGLTQAADYYIGVGDYRRAQEYLGRVLIDYPDSPDLAQVLLNRGICQFKLGQNADALGTLYKVMEEHAGTEMAHSAEQYVEQINQKRGK